MVAFGYEEQGMGEVQSEVQEVVEEEVQPVESVQTPTTPVDAVEEVVTQETVETVTIEKKEEKKEEKVEPVVEDKPSPSDALTKAMNKASTTKASETGGKGETGQPGNQGKTHGDPNSNNYNDGDGNGISFDLSGRKMIQRPKVEAKFTENSKVVVSITVDKYGTVTRATGGVRGSTTTNANLIKISEDAAKRTKFNGNPDLAEEQTGTMTFIFILK